MTQNLTPKPFALAAISVLMASTAAPSIAQDSAQAQAPATAASAAPPPVAVTPITEAPPPVAATTTSAAQVPAPTPVVAEPAASPAEVAPAAKTAVTHSVTHSARQQSAARAKPAPVVTKAVPEKPAAKTVDTSAKDNKDNTAPTTVPGASPDQSVTTTQSTAQARDQSPVTDWTMIGVIGGLAALGAAGTGLTLASRRRRYGEQPAEALTAEAETAQIASMPAAMAPAPQPAEAFAAQPEPVRKAAPLALAETDLGRHERLAEQGPTPDNPFLTRRARVRRARFYDRRERLALEQARQPLAIPAQPAQAPVQEAALKTPATQLTYSFGAKKNPGWIATPVLKRR